MTEIKMNGKIKAMSDPRDAPRKNGVAESPIKMSKKNFCFNNNVFSIQYPAAIPIAREEQ